MAETIRIGRETGIRVVGSHIKAKGPTTWGQSAIDVMAIDRVPGGRHRGVSRPVPVRDVRWRLRRGDPALWNRRDFAPDYNKNLRAPLNDSVLREQMITDIEYILDLQGGADRHIIVISPQDEALMGRTLADVASESSWRRPGSERQTPCRRHGHRQA